MPDSAPAVEVDDLHVAFGDVHAVAGLSFAAARGAVTALLGPNGAGKSTTIDVLCGFRRPDSGAARVLGLEPAAHAVALARRLGVMPQQPGVHTGLRPIEALDLYASFYDDPLDPEVVLAEVGLEARRATAFRKLSGGEQQRLSLALALIGRPEVVLLDEPTAGIDPEGRRLIRERIAHLRDEGVSVVLTTHDLDEVERLADHVVIVDHGRAIAAGSPDELMRASGGATVRFGAPSGLDVDALGAAIGAPVIEASRGEYEVAADGTPTLVAALTAWLAARDVPLGDLRAGRQRLEDVFVQLTSEQSVAAESHADAGARRTRRRTTGNPS